MQTVYVFENVFFCTITSSFLQVYSPHLITTLLMLQLLISNCVKNHLEVLRKYCLDDKHPYNIIITLHLKSVIV